MREFRCLPLEALTLGDVHSLSQVVEPPEVLLEEEEEEEEEDR